MFFGFYLSLQQIKFQLQRELSTFDLFIEQFGSLYVLVFTTRKSHALRTS